MPEDRTQKSEHRSQDTELNVQGSKLKARDSANKIKPFLIALWFSLLFLPFKGLKAALILFVILSITIILLKTFWGYVKSLREMIRSVSEKAHSMRMTSSSLRVVHYAMFIFLLVFPFFAGDYMLDISILSGIYAILALGLNVIIGFTGLLHLGFAAFYAIGAYTYALLNVKLGIGFWQSLPLSMGFAAISAFILAVPALRLRGDYLAIVTLGFGEIIHLILNNLDSLTGGPNGISGISPPYIFGISLGRLNKHYYLILFAVMLTYIVVKRIRSSRIGRAWIAIREDEIGASAMGINTTRFKLYAFIFGSIWAGLAGALFAAKMQFVSPESFTFIESVLIVCMVILGGQGSITGVVVGAFILIMLPEVLREVQSYRMLALGVGLIIMMIFRPQGLLSGIKT